MGRGRDATVKASKASLAARRQAVGVLLVLAATGIALGPLYLGSVVEAFELLTSATTPAFAELTLIVELLTPAMALAHAAMVWHTIRRIRSRRPPVGSARAVVASAALAGGLASVIMLVALVREGPEADMVLALLALCACFVSALPIPWRTARPASELAVALRVTPEGRAPLVHVPVAGRGDFLVGVDLPGGRASLDLYGHYLVFLREGGHAPYRATDWLCKTHVKFGQVMQDRLRIDIEIRPAGP